MKILVTGGAGFIGSNIVDAYVAQGHEVTVLDDLSSGKKKQVHPKAAFHTMDVRDPNISTLFAKNGFDIVNHHAAQIDVRRSMQDPFSDASINVLGTLRLLECCRTYGVRKFIFASSGGVMYGECKTAANESVIARPESPYGFSKAAAETYVRFYGSAYKIPYTIFRYGNVYGPRQDVDGEAGVVAIFAGRMLAGEPVSIYGDGKQERDFVYVGDVVEANCAALTRGENDTYNIGSGRPTSVLQLFEALAKLTQYKHNANFSPARAGELQRSLLDSDHAHKYLGWKASHSLEQALSRTLQSVHSPKKSTARRS